MRRAVFAVNDADRSEFRRLGTFEGETPAFDDLTDRQEKVLRTAYGMSHFAVPREVSTDELADGVGLDSSTVAEHLQRAEKNLLSKHFRDGQQACSVAELVRATR